MKFSEYYKTKPKVESHMEHIEDLIICDPYNGVHEFFGLVSGIMNNQVRLGEKIDGSPCVFFGKHPSTGKFFVSTKSILGGGFVPLYNSYDVDTNYSGQLADIFNNLLKYLPEIYYGDKIYQMDLLFAISEQKRVEDIGGVKHLIFTPNTITYAVPIGTALFPKFLSSNIAGVVHGVYVARHNDEEQRMSLEKDDSIHIKSFVESTRVNNRVLFLDMENDNLSRFSIEVQTKQYIERIMNRMGESKSRWEIVDHDFSQKWKESKLNKLMKLYLNSQLRGDGNSIFSASVNHATFEPERFRDGFTKFIQYRYSSDIAKLKREFAIARKTEEQDSIKRIIANIDSEFYKMMFLYYDALLVKNALLKTISEVKSIVGKTFFRNGKDLIPTSIEGAVVYANDHMVKIVDRLSFSKRNFLRDINK